MATQKGVYEFMEQFRDDPGVAEAAFLAAKYLKPEQINENLRLRYGSGQGFARFKDSFAEYTEYTDIESEYSRYGAQVELRTDEDSARLDEISVRDVDIDLDEVIQHAFRERVAVHLQEDVFEDLSARSQEAKTIAYLARRGYDLGTWDDRTEPDGDTLWRFYSIITGDTPTEPMKRDVIKELVQCGCLYADGNDIILTPTFVGLEDPYGELPQLDLQTSE